MRFPYPLCICIQTLLIGKIKYKKLLVQEENYDIYSRNAAISRVLLERN